MKCSACGQPIPPSSQFCLRCGAAASKPAAGSIVERPGGLSATGSGPKTPPPAPARTLLYALLVLALVLIIATALVLHNKHTVVDLPPAGALANAPAAPPPAGALANAPSVSLPPAGALANAPAPPPPPAGALANASATVPPAGALANNPASPPPIAANAPDDVMPYLQALAKIEADRQLADQQLMKQLLGGQAAAAKAPAGANDDGTDIPGMSMNDFRPGIQAVSSQYISLLQRVRSLETTPGVPASCKDLQGYYVAALNPFVTLPNAIQTHQGGGGLDLLGTLPALLSVVQEEGKRVSQAQSALTDVFNSHKIQPFFAIKEADGSNGNAPDLMGKPYVPVH